ncbi:MAG: hypothetical protein MJE68_30650 [Proteobacteria bacterium]|nr:hypothetical protein [Pseudomonadota bacterium]
MSQAASRQYPKYPSPHQYQSPSGTNGNMAVLAERVETATRTMPASQAPLSVDDAFARMKAVTQIRPRTAEEVDRKSSEYAFGETFAGMVQHIVTGYLDKAVVPIIHRTIMSEIDRLASDA